MMRQLFVLLLISISHYAYSSPRLQMHVFDDDSPVITAPSKAMTNRNDVFSPARKHRLQTHVFVASDHAVTAVSSGQDINKTVPFEYQRAEFYMSTGYRQDNFHWSISGPNGTPNILSELSWKDIDIATFNVGTTLHFQPNWLLNIDASYGHIFEGRNQDSDYDGNNRTLEYSRSNNNADQGKTYDASINTAYQFLVLKENQYEVHLIPKVGYSYHAQFFNMTDGFQTIPASGHFSGRLDSHYDAIWQGPWLGLESQIDFNKNFTLSTNVEYHYAFYDATANWNLRPDFAHPESFTHEARGYGLVGNIDARYRLDNDLSLTMSINYQEWQANRNGVDTTFFSDGSSITTGFNGVSWRSFGANLGLNYEF